MSKDKETLVKYLDGKVQIKSKPLAGENIPVYVRPGDKIDLELLGLNLETAKFKLVGGDLILEIPGAGEFTFVSLALMGYSGDAPEFLGVAGKIVTLSSILSDIDDINALPINSTPTNEYINMLNEIAQENKKEVAPQVIIIDNNPATEQNDNVSNLFDLLEAQKKSLNLVESNDFTSNLTKTDSKKSSSSSSSSSSKQEDNVASVEGIEPTLSFDIDIQHVQIRENTTIDTSNLKTLTVHGGGGTSYANIYPKGYNLVDKTALVAQTKTETIDYSDKSGSYDHVVIHADDSALFDITKTLRTIQLTPSQPEGFQITEITISIIASDATLLPADFLTLYGVSGNGTWTIQKDNPLTEEIDGFTIDNKGAINFTFSVDNTQESNSVFTIKATSVFDINNVSEANKATIIPPVKKSIEFTKEYAVQVKEIENYTLQKEYDFESFDLNGKQYTTGFVITTNINDTETKGSQELVNTIFGGIVNDTIYGGTKNDTIYGYSGDDTIFSSAGNDTIDGGVGSDTLNYSKIDNVNNIGINANLVTGIVTGDGTDTISNIENIIGTQDKDIIIGNEKNNTLKGEAGDDTIEGGAGENTLYGGTGVDVIYAATTKTGTERGDVVFGGQGIDTLIGSFHKDFLIGGEQNGYDVETDWIDYSNLVLGANDYGISVNLEQTTNFTDTVDRAYLNGNYSQVFRLDANGNTLNFDYISQIENITGSSGDDTFTGNTSQNSILAGAGDDIIYYTRGLDYYDGGNHTTSSGQGSGTPSVGGGDWISLAKETTTTVNFDLYNSSVGANITNSSATVTNIENIIGYNGVQATTGWGTTGNNTFVMYGGNDNIIGREGNDVYDLGAGDDIAQAGSGNDTIIGGVGSDRLDYYSNYGGTQGSIIILTNQDLNGDGDTADANETVTLQTDITVQGLSTLADGTYTFFKIRDGRTTFFDYLYRESDGTADIEIFYLTNITAQADIFSGDADANTVYAYAGNDTIYGQGGNDIVYGGNGNDLVHGGLGNDSLYGENDVDTLYGNDGADRLEGGLGADKLYGGNGNDTIYSDDGADIIDGGADIDLLLFTGGTNRVVVNLSTSAITYDTTNQLAANSVLDVVGYTDTVVNLSIENVTGGTGADTFMGSTGNNTLNGGDGNDYFYSSIGADSIIGGNGTDTLDFTNLTTTAGVNGTLTSFAFNSGGTAYTTTASGLENFTGSAQNDNFTGDGAANLLIGGTGNDTLNGAGGADVIYGGIGDDSIDGGAANDTLYGDAGNDLFTIDFSSVDTIDGGANTLKDTIKFNTGNTGTSISADANFVMNSTLTNIEKLDITGLTLNTANDNTEFNFTEAMIDAWTGNSTGNLTLSLKSSQVEKIMFTDSGGTVRDSAAEIVDNTTYTIGNNTLTIDIIDVP